MSRAFRRLIYWGGYLYAALVIPGCAVCAGFLRLAVADERRRERLMRSVISAGAAGFVRWLQIGGAIEIDGGAVAARRERSGVIFAANHPTFIDAIFLFALLEQVFCVVKSSIRRDVMLSPITRIAGYLPASTPLRLVQESCRRLRRGENLLVFPEGTRSPGRGLQRFKAGFALVAVRSGAPVQTIHVESGNGGFMRKGHPFFSAWQPLPLRYHFRAGREFVPGPNETSGEFLARVEAYFQGADVARPVADLAPGR